MVSPPRRRPPERHRRRRSHARRTAAHTASASTSSGGLRLAHGAVPRILALSPGGDAGRRRRAPTTDAEAVAQLLGRDPGGAFTVVVRGDEGRPVVIANEPFLRDGTPMPTRYWLVDPALRVLVGRLEAGAGSGGPRRRWTRRLGRGPSPLCRRARCADSGGLAGPRPERGRGRHTSRGQVPARPCGLVAGRR